MSTTGENARSPWQELVDARLALAKLEVQHDIATSRRLGVVAGCGAVIVIIGLTLLTFVAAETMAVMTKSDPFWWQFAFGVTMTFMGVIAIYAGWRRFRREFSCLAETFDELREDKLWLTEIAAQMLRVSSPTAAESDDE